MFLKKDDLATLEGHAEYSKSLHLYSVRLTGANLSTNERLDTAFNFIEKHWIFTAAVLVLHVKQSFVIWSILFAEMAKKFIPIFKCCVIACS